MVGDSSLTSDTYALLVKQNPFTSSRLHLSAPLFFPSLPVSHLLAPSDCMTVGLAPSVAALTTFES